MRQPDNVTPPDLILPPPAVPLAPDKDTRSSPDYTGDSADGRVFYFNKFGIKYGVDDKAQAAAFVLSILLIILLALAMLLGSLVERTWLSDIFKLLVPALTFTAGVAIGKGGRKD